MDVKYTARARNVVSNLFTVYINDKLWFQAAKGINRLFFSSLGSLSTCTVRKQSVSKHKHNRSPYSKGNNAVKLVNQPAMFLTPIWLWQSRTCLSQWFLKNLIRLLALMLGCFLCRNCNCLWHYCENMSHHYFFVFKDFLMKSRLTHHTENVIYHTDYSTYEQTWANKCAGIASCLYCKETSLLPNFFVLVKKRWCNHMRL